MLLILKGFLECFENAVMKNVSSPQDAVGDYMFYVCCVDTYAFV